MSNNYGKILNGRCREIIFNVVNYFTTEEAKTKPLLKKLLIILSTSLAASEVSVPRDIFFAIVEVLKTNSKIFNRALTATGVSKSIVTSVRIERTERSQKIALINLKHLKGVNEKRK